MGHAVGTDHIDLEYCRRNGIQVMNSTNCNSETVAEHAISLVCTSSSTPPLPPWHKLKET